MALNMSSLILTLLLIAGAYSFPAKYGGEFTIGGTTKTQTNVGVGGEVGLDGKALTGTLTGSVGGKVDSTGHGGFHLQANDKEFGAGGTANVNVGGQFDRAYNGAIGLPQNNKALLAVGRNSKNKVTGELTGAGMFGTGEDSRDLVTKYTSNSLLDSIVHGKQAPVY